MDFFIRNIIHSEKALWFVIFFLLVLLLCEKVSHSKKIRASRKDAVLRSKSVIGGQIAEQFAPFMPDFPCNPNDAHFIGRPVDFIAFPGLTEKNTVDEILLIEVKSGESCLSNREKEVRKAVKEGRVKYVEYRV